MTEILQLGIHGNPRSIASITLADTFREMFNVFAGAYNLAKGNWGSDIPAMWAEALVEKLK